MHNLKDKLLKFDFDDQKKWIGFFFKNPPLQNRKILINIDQHGRLISPLLIDFKKENFTKSEKETTLHLNVLIDRRKKKFSMLNKEIFVENFCRIAENNQNIKVTILFIKIKRKIRK